MQFLPRIHLARWCLMAVAGLSPYQPMPLRAQTSSHHGKTATPEAEDRPAFTLKADLEKPSAAAAAVSTIDPAEIEGFDTLPAPIRKLLLAALDLTKRNLTYTYGSSDPASGGMDCSGTIYYLLRQAGCDDVPRDSGQQYEWVCHKSHFYAVRSKKEDTAERCEIRPGDLLFWTGTYRVDRDPPISHVMIYLGRRKRDGLRLMFGASDGRSYDGQRRNGVSVFDFKMPAVRSGLDAVVPDDAPAFFGYGAVPGRIDLNDSARR